MKVNDRLANTIWFSCKEKRVAEKKTESPIDKEHVTSIDFESPEEIENTIILLRELEGIVIERDLFHKAPDNDPIDDLLPDSPIDVARMLIYAKCEYDTSHKMTKMINLPDKCTGYKYSIAELREIANHLLIFCDGHKEDETSR